MPFKGQHVSRLEIYWEFLEVNLYSSVIWRTLRQDVSLCHKKNSNKQQIASLKTTE